MRYGDVLPEGFEIPSSAFWLKNDLTPEGNPFRLLDIRNGDRVMDCGLYIGTFTAACLEQGASYVRGYEAAPQNAKIAFRNLARYGEAVQIIGAALTTTNNNTATLTMSNFSGANSILPSEHRKKSIEVPAVNFRRQLLEFMPDVLKLDVEGAEYDLFDSLVAGDLVSVRCLCVEFRPIDQRDTRVRTITNFILNEGLGIESFRLRAFIASRDSMTLYNEIIEQLDK